MKSKSAFFYVDQVQLLKVIFKQHTRTFGQIQPNRRTIAFVSELGTPDSSLSYYKPLTPFIVFTNM